MSTSPALPLRPSKPVWLEVLLPREHGSWSLALEPLALALLVAPSLPGAGLALAAAAGFLGRRPLKLCLREPAAWRRAVAGRVLAMLALLALAGVVAAIAWAGARWLPWLLPTVVAGTGFLWFDLRHGGREQIAEMLGATAFGFVSGAIAAAAGRPDRVCAVVVFAILARSLPTVLFVRHQVRAAKTGRRQPAPVGAIATLAGLTAAALAAAGWLPVAAAACAIALWLGIVIRLSPRIAAPRARALGIQEMAIGAAYVVVAGSLWPR